MTVRLAETVTEDPPAGVGMLLAATQRELRSAVRSRPVDPLTRLSDLTLDVELSVGEVLAMIGLLAEQAAETERLNLGGSR